MKFNRVSSFQTSDGAVHATKQLAAIRESEIAIRAIIHKAANTVGSGMEFGAGQRIALSTTQIAKLILDNGPEFAKILKDLARVK